MTIPDEYKNDSLTFSIVGYESQQKSIALLTKYGEVSLVEKTLSLQEVVITSEKIKTRKVGNKSNNPFLWGSIQSTNSNDILEFGQLIKLKSKLSHIVSAHVCLNSDKTLDSILVRINFYKTNNEFPGQRLFEKPIIKKIKLTKGWNSFDLSQSHLVTKDDFYITYEILPNKEIKKRTIFFRGKLAGKNGVSRTTSLGEWEVIRGASISTYVTVEQ